MPDRTTDPAGSLRALAAYNEAAIIPDPATFSANSASGTSMAAQWSEYEVDELTLARLRRGDMDACEKVYRQFQRPVYTVIVRVVNCRELAQDISQEAFITAFRRVGQFRGDAPFWGWLRRLAVNHAISALRKLPKAELVTFEDYQASSEGAEAGISLAMDLQQALALLNAEDRAIVWLYDVEGYKHTEIAKLFGKSESFSKTRLSRAREQLRELLGQMETQGTVAADA
jgi:RNA polymerase sigma-70 factor (ECF subfamily)